jgi:cytochrome b6-f complex iron-sulfur subunit
MEDNSTSPSQRRFFLTTILGLIGGAMTAIGLWPIWRYLSPGEKIGPQQKVAIASEKLAEGQAYFFQFHGHPAVLVEKSPREFIALSAVCTHLGCIVQWQAKEHEFLCPCHAGRYTIDGKVISGPPPKPLPTYPVTVQGDQILVG